jgi:hypothetical protein
VFSEVRIVVTMVDEVNGEENAESLSSAQHQYFFQLPYYSV